MKITKSQIQQIIREELNDITEMYSDQMDRHDREQERQRSRDYDDRELRRRVMELEAALSKKESDFSCELELWRSDAQARSAAAEEAVPASTGLLKVAGFEGEA